MEVTKVGSIQGRCITAAVLAGLSASVSAETPQDRYWIGLEYFYPTITSTARFDATATSRPGLSLIHI